VLIGVEGLGKMALSRLAIYICQYQIRELKHTAEFSRDDWHTLIKAMFESTAIDKRTNVSTFAIIKWQMTSSWSI